MSRRACSAGRPLLSGRARATQALLPGSNAAGYLQLARASGGWKRVIPIRFGIDSLMDRPHHQIKITLHKPVARAISTTKPSKTVNPLPRTSAP
jgi:hypothetical protein